MMHRANTKLSDKADSYGAAFCGRIWNMSDYYLMTFESTHAAISTEKLLKPADVSIMPVPRFLSASCGISVRIRPDKREAAEKLFKEGSKLKPGEYAYYCVHQGDGKDDVVCERIEMK